MNIQSPDQQPSDGELGITSRHSSVDKRSRHQCLGTDLVFRPPRQSPFHLPHRVLRTERRGCSHLGHRWDLRSHDHSHLIRLEEKDTIGIGVQVDE